MQDDVSKNSPVEWPRFVASWSLSPCSLSPWPLSLELTMSASWNAELEERGTMQPVTEVQENETNSWVETEVRTQYCEGD